MSHMSLSTPHLQRKHRHADRRDHGRNEGATHTLVINGKAITSTCRDGKRV